MFFKAFASVEGSTLPNSLIFTIEHQASQVLAHGDLSALRKAVEEQNLPGSLFEEVEFFGTIPRGKRDEVREYFQSHAKTLYETAQQLLSEPDNEALRHEVQQPLLPEDELRRILETA